jgi:hypothetical protein
LQPTNRQAETTEPVRWGRLKRSALSLWAMCALVVTGSLASAHEYTLPHPDRRELALTEALGARVLPQERGRFTVTHVLYAECRCSQRILEHLAARRARRDVSESVLLVAPAAELTLQLLEAGYRVEALTPVELQSRYAIEAAPLMIVADPLQHIRYLGGYTARKQGLDIRDGAIIDNALAGKDSTELPLFGCAISRALRKLVDPLGLVYAAESESDSR